MEDLNDELAGLVGPPVEVTEEVIDASRTHQRFGALIYELYKETGRVVCAISAAFSGDQGEAVAFDRNQAICVGLLVRISKLMASVVKLSADIEHGETILALNRCIIESAVNVRYLLLKDDEGLYDKFVTSSLVAERELYDMIQGNIEARNGERLAIEEGMIESIEATCEQSGVELEAVNRRAERWGGSFRDKLTAIGEDPSAAYTVLQRMSSHYIHGDWVDLVKNHLVSADSGFEPNWDHLSTDGRLLGPIGIYVVDAAREYLVKYFDPPSAEPLLQRLDSVQQRLIEVEASRQDWRIVE